VTTERGSLEDAIIFATERDLEIVSCELTHVVAQTETGPAVDLTPALLERKDVPCFSDQPRPGDTMAIGLSAAAPSCAVAVRLDSRVDGVGVDPRQPPLVWEAWTSGGWRECEVGGDTTGGLNRPGEVILHVPEGHTLSRLGVHEAAWLRCRVLAPLRDQPFYSVSPTIRSADVFTVGGTTGAVHGRAVLGELLGESSGIPGQRFRTAHAPVIPPVVIESSAGEGWEKWEVVEHFAASGPDDRHVVLDATSGEFAFGPALREPDGTVRQCGAVPPKGAMLRVNRYHTGGGRAGNVARGALCVPRDSIPYVTRVENREAARGGADGETLAEAKLRAPISLRAQDRAVTQRDYEELSRRAAPDVARVRCLTADPGEHGDGAVRVLVVPQAVPDRGGRLRFEQLVPGDDMLRRISRYLDERRPIGTRLAVGPPFYQGVTVVTTLHAYPSLSSPSHTEQVRAAALEALYRYLDPLTGGAEGAGWPFGRPVQTGEIFAVLQRVPGVQLVGEVKLYPADPLTGRRADAADRIDLPAAALVFSFDHKVRVVGGES
jgi:predicted phage baseplate assembly protein